MDSAEPARELAIARPDDPALTHLAVVGDTYTVLLSGEQTAGRFAMLDMLIPPGGGPPPHRHAFEECFRVLEGAIEVHVGEAPPVVLQEGDTANVPANAPHRFVNAADVPARLLCTVAPAGLERYFAEFGDPVPARTSPAPSLSDAEREERLRTAVAKAPEYGMAFVDPTSRPIESELPTMKAVRFHQYGDAGVLRYEDAEQPAPGPGEVRLRVAATSFNPVDGGIRGGYLQGPFPVTLPHTPGIDVAGTVDALGEGVADLAVGDAVIGFLPMTAPGASAEYVVALAGILAPAPTTIPLADVAALPMVGLTAWQALFDDAGLEAGQRVLINGAGGAVGGYAVQLAKRAGAHVIATASPRSAERVASAGADEVIDHTTSDVAAAVSEPVDALLNLARIGAEELVALAALVKPGGVVVNTVPTIETPADEARGVRAVGVFVRSDAEQLSRLAALVDGGELRVDVARRVPLSDLPAVHAQDDAGELSGKVVVVVATDG